MRSDSLHTIFTHLPGHIRAPVERAAVFYEDKAREIILRADRPVTIECAGKRYYLTADGMLTEKYDKNDLSASRSDISMILKSLCDYSVYARQNDLNSGFITIKNGVRVGLCGTAVQNGGDIVNIKDITTLDFRIASEIVGCADYILDRIDPLGGVLICGAPCSGKTTIIRDMARRLSAVYKVSLIDERNEISASFNGICGYDIGSSDVFVGLDKGKGIISALRSLSPDIIICDELGDSDDIRALRNAVRCGAAVIATIHARGIEDLRARSATSALLKSDAFRYVVILGDRHSAGKIQRIVESRDIYY